MLHFLRTLERRRRTYRNKLLGGHPTLTSGLFVLAGLLAFVGIVDWPNIPFAIAAAALGGFLVVTVVFAPIGLLFL